MKDSSLKSRDCLIVLSSLYATVAVAMNVFCMKPLSFGSGIVICDGGLLISWLVFLVSNVVVEVWGERESLKIVFTGAVLSFALLILGRLIVFIPTLPEYSEQASAFALVFSNGIRTIASSAAAFALGGAINVRIIALMKKRKCGGKVSFFFRSVFSTLLGQAVDNAVFMTLAFAPVGLSLYEMAWKDIATSVISGTILETAVESFFVPLITIPLSLKLKKIKEAEEKA